MQIFETAPRDWDARVAFPIMSRGFADAAATLGACDALWGTGFGRDELANVAAGLGSDVPFLVLGGTALLIAVQVILDLVNKIDAQVSLREY